MTASLPPRRTVIPAVLTLFAGGIFLGLDQAALGIVLPTVRGVFHFGTVGSAWAGGIQSLPEGLAGFLLAGAISDRLADRKLLLLGSLAAFALMAWLTAAVGSLGTLLLVRALMGVFAGGWIAMMFALATELPAPRWRAITVGFTLASQPIGSGLMAPTLLPHLAAAVGWRWMYVIIGAPALAVALAGTATVPRGILSQVDPLEPARSALSLSETFRHRNVVLSVILSALLYCTLTLFVIFGVEYFVTQGFTVAQAGSALSAWGIGGAVGALVIPRISDRIGRRPATVIGSAVAALSVLLFVASSYGAWQVVSLVGVGFFVQGTLPIVIMLVPGETVEDRLRGKAIGLADVGTTTLGGGVFAITLGSIGASFGLHTTFVLGVACCACAAVLALALRETAPNARRAPRLSRQPAELEIGG
jgi:MFS family permease